MNHPTRDELAAFLYEEVTPDRHTEVSRHLEECAVCRTELASWRQVRQELAAWSLPERSPATNTVRPAATAGIVCWRLATLGAAAAVLVLAGFGLARWTTAQPLDAAGLRAAIVQELRSDLRAELSRFATDQGLRQEQFQQALTKTLGRLEAQRLADYANLRRDMETVAVRAEDELLNTRESLNRLAASDAPKTAVIP